MKIPVCFLILAVLTGGAHALEKREQPNIVIMMVDEANSFIERNKDRPFAVTVTFNAPHMLKVVKPARLIEEDYEKAKAAGKRWTCRRCRWRAPERRSASPRDIRAAAPGPNFGNIGTRDNPGIGKRR